MKTIKSDLLVIGSGGMAAEYLKVLRSLGRTADIVGRGASNLNKLKESYPENNYYYDGLDSYFNNQKHVPQFAINTVNIEYLGAISEKLLIHGIKYLLIEKPGDLDLNQLKHVSKISRDKGSEVYIAYNRRFYSSVTSLISEVKKDGGITSVSFEFTEWAHTFGPDTHSLAALNKWVISNSSHVIDTVFYLIGKPKELFSKVIGKKNIEWHPSGSIFIGAGISTQDIPFTYNSNWSGPGRWAIEVVTRKKRYYLKPMEQLFEQSLGSISLNKLEIDDILDLEYKPGLFLQTKSFLELNFKKMQSIESQIEAIKIYQKISGY